VRARYQPVVAGAGERQEQLIPWPGSPTGRRSSHANGPATGGSHR